LKTGDILYLYIGLGFTDCAQKRPILSASVGVDKTLLYSSRMQTTCARKRNGPAQTVILQQR